MESADDVRASLDVASLADLSQHEATSPDGESRVADLLRDARALSWPLVVDAGSGLILDGSHRAVVLARDLGARFVVVQRVALDAPDVRIGAWCLILEGVSAEVFGHARRALGLEMGASGSVRCHYGGRVYARPELEPEDASRLAAALERMLSSSNGHRPRARLVEDDAAPTWLGAADVVVLRPPALDKAVVRQRAGGALLPPKSTRFLLPYRVIGLRVPLEALGGPRPALVDLLERERERPLACLGSGLAIDRRYPERLWQFADHRIPDRLFADEAGRRAYLDVVARVALPAPSRPDPCRHRPQA
jgi:hypothetical protein